MSESSSSRLPAGPRPTPWRLSADGVTILDRDGRVIVAASFFTLDSPDLDAANAELIVRCVNQSELDEHA